MVKIIKKIIKLIFLILVIVIIGVGCFFLYSTITDYKPKETESVDIFGKGKNIDSVTVFSLLSWNIGYGALGKEMDFFYDGGKTVIPPENKYHEYLAGIKNTLSGIDTIPFILLQEVDINSKRTSYDNQLESFALSLPTYSYSFARNYDVKYIPFPLGDPMGKVVSGIASFSCYKPVEATRYAFSGNFSWPKSLFFLDRCFLLSRYKLNNNKDLVIINTHNSAFDNENELKPKELALIKSKAIEEYSKGNYVIIGGDWNQNPPKYDSAMIIGGSGRSIPPSIDENLMPPDWQWIFQESFPTNRDVDKSYIKGSTKTSIIDFFLLSPNLEALFYKTIDLEFENSDHQPIFIKIKLKA